MSRLRLGASSLTRSGRSSSAVATIHIGRVNASTDDAEQTEADTIFLTSADLELAMDDVEGECIVGLRFNDVQIERGSQVSEAYVVFTARSFNSDEAAVVIRAQADDDAPTFGGIEEDDLSARPATAASATWPLAPWASEQVNEDTTTPNLAALISEVVNRPGWVKGNSLVLLFYRHPDSPKVGSSRRAAHSYDSDPDKAPLLMVNQAPEFQVEEPAQPADPPVVSGSIFSLEGDESFDKDKPKLKNGTLLTGEALTIWQGINWLIENHKAKKYVQGGGSNVDQLADNDNLYHYARYLANVYDELALILRLFGDLRALDEWVSVANIQANELGRQRRKMIDPSKLEWPRHDYRMWVWDQGHESYNGSDDHNQDNPRAHQPIAHLLAALRANEGKTSPGGVKLPNGNTSTYGGVADFWEDYLRDWVKIWSGDEERIGYTQGGSPASGWSANYDGNAHNYYKNLVGARPDAGDWPIQSRHHFHTHVGASALHYYLGQAIGDFSDATAVGLGGITDLVFDLNMFYFRPAGARYSGDYGIWPRSLWRTGHSSGGNYPQPSTYLGYITKDLLNMWLDGALPTFPEVFAKPVVRTANEYMFRNLASNEGMQADLLNNGSLTGNKAPEAADGYHLDFTTSMGNSGNQAGAARSNAQLVLSPFTALIAFDTSDDHFEKHVWGNLTSGSWGRMGTSSAFYDGSNPLLQPRVFSPSIGLLLKRLGAASWAIE